MYVRNHMTEYPVHIGPRDTLSTALQDNRPGQVAGVTAVAKRLGINIAAVALHDVNLMHTMTLVMKVETDDPQPLLEGLRQAHYVVREVQKI